MGATAREIVLIGCLVTIVVAVIGVPLARKGRETARAADALIAVLAERPEVGDPATEALAALTRAGGIVSATPPTTGSRAVLVSRATRTAESDH